MATTKILATDSVKHGKPDRMPGARSGRRLIIYTLMAIALVAALGSAGLAWREADLADKASRIAADVQVGDLLLGGMTVAQAEDAIKSRYGSLVDTQIALALNGRNWSFPAAKLGVGLDAEKTARDAYGAHSGEVAAADETVTNIPLVFTYDRNMAREALNAVSAEVAVAPVSADLKISTEGITLTPEKTGQKMNVEATLDNIAAATIAYPFGSGAVVTDVVPALITTADLVDTQARANLLTGEAVTLTLAAADGTAKQWQLSSADLRGMLLVSKNEAGITSVEEKLNDAALLSFLNGIAPELKREPVDATLALPDFATSVVMTPDVSGQELNVEATLGLLQVAAGSRGTERTVQAVINEIKAPVQASALQPVKDNMDRVLSQGILLKSGERSYQIPAEEVVLKLYLERVDGAEVPYRPLVYDADMAELAADSGNELDTKAKSATYRRVNGQVALVTQPQVGYIVDEEATALNIKAAFLEGKTEAELVGEETQPAFSDTSLTTISTPDLLAADSTFYGNSSVERNHNVTLGAERLDGWYVPPGAIFSVNEALGPLTLDAGFKMGWGILVQNGNATTIPSEAGGICQVVTTLFHPLFWVGVPFTERHHHSYWIEKYGIEPMGLKGLDATIDPPWSDLKFKNTTGNWLLIRLYGDKQNVKAEVWGTNTGWRVDVADPVITNVVKTDPKMRYENNDQLPEGKTVVVETAQDGFTVDIHRQVWDASGTLIDDYHAKGTYLPAHNVTVVGTGKNLPAQP